MFGIFLAITCAFTWSLSVIILKQASVHVHPLVLNLGKNLLGLVLLIPTAYLIDGPLPDIELTPLLVLIASGFFGIGIADALVLKAMKQLSATKIAILECLFAPFVITFSVIFFEESLTITHSIGAVSIGIAILLVLPKGQPQQDGQTRGSIYMCIGMLTMAAGIMMVKPLFDVLPLFWIITVRMLAGVFGSLLPLYWLKEPSQEFNHLLIVHNKGQVLLGFVLSAYVSISLWIAGYKYLDASIASVLNQTSTIFTVLLAVLILNEKFTLRKILATCFATAGVIVMSVH